MRKGRPHREAGEQESGSPRTLTVPPRRSSPFPPGLLPACYEALLARLGPQGWWPGESPLEVCIGAVLTQNTAWRNVERVIAALRDRGLIDAAALAAMPEEEIASLIRGAGYHNQKARTLRAFASTLVERFGGDLAAMLGGPLPEARRRLLGIRGIGPETADSMLLYAGDRPVFVVGVYTRRLLARHGLAHEGEPYASLQARLEEALPRSVALYKEFHALAVALGKQYCRARSPRCGDCPLAPVLGPPPAPPSLE